MFCCCSDEWIVFLAAKCKARQFDTRQRHVRVRAVSAIYPFEIHAIPEIL